MLPDKDTQSNRLDAAQSAEVLPGPSWLDRIFDMRNALVMKPAFREWAAWFYPTRFIARRQTEQLFDVLAGFVYSQILQTCVQLELFELLKTGQKSVSQIAKYAELEEDAAWRLLNGAAALKLVHRRSANMFALGAHGAVLAGDPGLVAMIRHHSLLYEDLNNPVSWFRGTRKSGKLSRFWSYSGNELPGELDGEDVTAYSQLMTSTQHMIANELLASCSLERHKRVLDLGGGEGECAIRLARADIGADFGVFDLPPVAARARARILKEGLSGRIKVHSGDLMRREVPEGYDCMLLVRILHDHNDEDALQILKSAKAALQPGQRLVVAEPMAGKSSPELVGDAYFGVYLLAMAQGRPRSPKQNAELLQEAGFGTIREHKPRNPLILRVMSATA